MNAKTPDNLMNQTPEQSQGGSDWKDPKRYMWLLGPGLPLIGFGALSAYAVAPKKLRALSWTGPLLVHGVIPYLDRKIGKDHSNPPSEAVRQLEEDKYYERIVKAFIPGQYAVTLLGTWLATRKKTPMSDKIGLALSVGAINGIGINTGHELGHKPSKRNKLLAMAALAPTGYTHFVVEHNFGHHKRVATPEDPASARMGESFWKFLPRTVVGGIKSAIDIEKKRLARRGKGFWTPQNELLQGWAMSAGFFGATTLICGPRAVPFLAAQAVYGASLLETVNYLEHYGLKRQQDENGKYERTKPEHSWNSNELVTNLFLYQLQRHSDHHANPTRSYQALRHFEEVPELPGGYASMLMPAYLPNWWFEMMDKRVIEHYKGDMSRINMDPDRKEELLEKYAEYAAQVRTRVAQEKQAELESESQSESEAVAS